MDELTDGTTVEWNTAGGIAYGEVRETIEDGQYDEEIDGDQKVEAPAALVETYSQNSGKWERDGQFVAHKPETLTVRKSFPDK